MKTQDLIGAQLDWAVAKCEGYECEFGDEVSGPWLVPQEGYLHDEKPLASFRPTTDWNLAGPIITQEGINLTMLVEGEVDPEDVGSWCAAYDRDNFGDGEKSCTASTPLIAAMRVYIMAKFGDEINIPEELK